MDVALDYFPKMKTSLFLAHSILGHLKVLEYKSQKWGSSVSSFYLVK